MVSTQTANVQVQDRGNLQQNRSGMSSVNVGQVERWASLLAGGVTALFGVVRDIRRGKPSGVGVTLACLGSGILYRGASGHSFIYQALGIDTTANNQSAQSVRVEKVVTVNRSPEELSHFWTNLDAAQQSEFATTSPGNSAFPGVQKNELEAWETLKKTVSAHGGYVEFERAPDERGTEVKVVLFYTPPAGNIGRTVTKLLGNSPEQQITEDLRRFKAMMEAGEIPTIEGQPSGPK